MVLVLKMSNGCEIYNPDGVGGVYYSDSIDVKSRWGLKKSVFFRVFPCNQCFECILKLKPTSTTGKQTDLIHKKMFFLDILKKAKNRR